MTSTVLTPLEAEMVRVLAGPKLSDRKTCEALGLTLDEARDGFARLRAKLGVPMTMTLRDAVRAGGAQP